MWANITAIYIPKTKEPSPQSLRYFIAEPHHFATPSGEKKKVDVDCTDNGKLIIGVIMKTPLSNRENAIRKMISGIIAANVRLEWKGDKGRQLAEFSTRPTQSRRRI